MSQEEFMELVKYAFAGIDLVDGGLVIQLKTEDGVQNAGIVDKQLKEMAKKEGIDPKTIDKIKELPPEQRQRYALGLLYRFMQNEKFKQAFISELKKRGVVNIPDTSENLAFLKVMKYLMILVIGGLFLFMILEMAGLSP